MRTPIKSLAETVLGLSMCFGSDGKIALKSCGVNCPYFNYYDCISKLHADARYYLVLSLKREVNEEIGEVKRVVNDDAISAEEFDRMYNEYMEDKEYAENNIL